jgi:2-methylcitrate dehydratase PrpD
MGQSTAIEKLSANVLDTRFEDIDKATLEATRYRIIDTLGCLIGGSTDVGNPELVDLFRNEGGRGEATILVHGGRVPVANAAFINSIMARSFDFGPVSPLVDGVSCPGHVSETTVPTVLTLAEAVNAGGREMITALLVGDDVASRILAGSGFGFTLGWDGVGTVNTFGVTAIAGRLLGLDRLQLRNAFGIALNLLGTTFQTIWDGTTAFKLPQGLAARAGIFSAQLAKAGWTGPEDALLSKFGYYKMFTEGCQKPEALTRGLGKNYYYDGTIKPYPCCRIPHAAIQASLELLNRHGIKAEDITSVNLDLAQGGIDHICGHPFKIGPFPHGNAAFSYQFSIATALLYGAVKPEHFTEKAIRDPRIKDFVGKIRFEADLKVPFESARVKLVMKDGREFAEYVEKVRGDPRFNPLSNDEKLAKFWTNVEFSGRISKQKAEKLLATIQEIDKLENVREMIPLLVA